MPDQYVLENIISDKKTVTKIVNSIKYTRNNRENDIASCLSRDDIESEIYAVVWENRNRLYDIGTTQSFGNVVAYVISATRAKVIQTNLIFSSPLSIPDVSRDKDSEIVKKYKKQAMSNNQVYINDDAHKEEIPDCESKNPINVLILIENHKNMIKVSKECPVFWSIINNNESNLAKDLAKNYRIPIIRSELINFFKNNDFVSCKVEQKRIIDEVIDIVKSRTLREKAA